MDALREKIDNMIREHLSASIVLVNGRKITTNPRFVFDTKVLDQGFLRWSYNGRSDEMRLTNITDIVFQQNKM